MYLSGDGTIMINDDPYVDGNIHSDVSEIIVSLLRRIEGLEAKVKELENRQPHITINVPKVDQPVYYPYTPPIKDVRYGPAPKQWWERDYPYRITCDDGPLQQTWIDVHPKVDTGQSPEAYGAFISAFNKPHEADDYKTSNLKMFNRDD